MSIEDPNELKALGWDRLSALVAVVPQHVVYRTLPAETVVLNIDTGTYYGMRGTGIRFFELIAEGKPLASIVEEIGEEYEATETTIHEDLIRFCCDLLAWGLIRLCHPNDLELSGPKSNEVDR